MQVLVVDIGSGSCRATLVAEDGRRPGAARLDRSYRPVDGVPGGFRFDTAETFDDIAGTIRKVLALADGGGSDVVAVVVSSIREGFVLYDGAGQELWACPNIDTRATAEADELAAEGIADELYRIGGDWTSVTAPAKLRWIQRHEPEVWRRAARLSMLADWVVHRLGGDLGTDPSLGSSSGLFDLGLGTWSDELAAALDVAELLPPVQPPGQHAGEISPEVAARTGLVVGTPIVRGGADTQLALLPSTIRADPPSFAVCGGTFWQTAVTASTVALDPQRRLRTICHAVPDRWVTEGIGFLHGTALRWLRDVLAPSVAGSPSFDELDALAWDVAPGADGVRFVGSSTQDVRRLRHPPVTLLGFDPGDPVRGGAGVVHRAIIEEACFVAQAHLERCEELVGCNADHIDLVGGAAASGLVSRVLASVLERDVYTYDHHEATTTGAAMLAWSTIRGDVPERWLHLAGERHASAPVDAWVEPYGEIRHEAEKLRAAILDLADGGVVPHRFIGAVR